jgi:alkyldihydroxyacetonephosphate synthase
VLSAGGPSGEDDIAAILRHHPQHGIAAVPFGGGSVIGGLDPICAEFNAVVSLDEQGANNLR